MKTSNILIALLFAFITKTSFTLASTSVVDINGDSIEPGVQYYVVSGLWGAGGGGLLLQFDPYKTCPEIVVQSPSDLQNGLPVVFSNADGTEDAVSLESNVTLTFVPLRFKLCTTSTTWQVVYDQSTGKNLVTLGGEKGDSASLFTLEKAGTLGYKFSHLGSDIGRYYDEKTGLIRLAESDTPWAWVFIKADASIKRSIKQVVNV